MPLLLRVIAAFLTESLSRIALSVLLALIAHQVFRLHETYSIVAHGALLFAPPLVLAAKAMPPSDSPETFFSALPNLLATYLTALTLSVLVYRASPFHPLARYPGPFVNRLSMFRMAFLSLSGKQHEYLKQLHELYGDVVRTGPNELSICDPSFVDPILGVSGLRKGPHILGRLLSNDTLTMVALQDTDEHLRRRRVWARGFSPSVLKEYEELMAVRVRQLVLRLKEQQGNVSLEKWIKAFAYDFMYDMAFGGGSEMLNGEKNYFWQIVEGSTVMMTFLSHVPWLGILLSYIPPATAPVRVLMKHCEKQTQRRIAGGSQRKDLFHYLNYEDSPEKEPPAMKQVIDDGILAIVAGADTVSTALSSLFGCLMAHPRVRRTLQAEVDKYYPAGEDVCNTQHHRKMRYLEAVINETLRLFPSIPGISQRQEDPQGLGTTIGNVYIPPGTNVWVHGYSMHRDPRNFSPSPDAFWPERWLIASDPDANFFVPLDMLHTVPGYTESRGSTSSAPSNIEETLDETPQRFVHNSSAFVPFSHGPMGCVGKGLARLELRVVVCALLQQFDIRPQSAQGFDLQAYERAFRDYFTTVHGAVPVVLAEKNGPEGNAQ